MTLPLIYFAFLIAFLAVCYFFGMKKLKAPPDDPRAAIMPVEYRKPESRQVSELAVGEAAYVSYSDIEVHPSGRAYVQTKTKLTEASPNWNIVRVRREADGFVVWLRKDTPQYAARPLFGNTEYVPVIQILVEES
jgi:hypothetical protein